MEPAPGVAVGATLELIGATPTPSEGLPVVPGPNGLTLSRFPQSITLPGMTSAALFAGG
ncbi:hypothetical protein GXW82_29375 [Streptacidiphilus sp. 4-A2]|nr:hypothetical protein [Streptacidiphilus sp. 4-A2]